MLRREFWHLEVNKEHKQKEFFKKGETGSQVGVTWVMWDHVGVMSSHIEIM